MIIFKLCLFMLLLVIIIIISGHPEPSKDAICTQSHDDFFFNTWVPLYANVAHAHSILFFLPTFLYGPTNHWPVSLYTTTHSVLISELQDSGATTRKLAEIYGFLLAISVLISAHLLPLISASTSPPSVRSRQRTGWQWRTFGPCSSSLCLVFYLYSIQSESSR